MKWGLTFSDRPLGWYARAVFDTKDNWSLYVKVFQWCDCTAIAKNALEQYLEMVVGELEKVRTRINGSPEVSVRMSSERPDEVIVTLAGGSLIISPVYTSAKANSIKPSVNMPFVKQ